VVLAAKQGPSISTDAALERLCRTYWFPLYAFVRLKGSPPEDAKDLTQAFFERFLEKRYVKNFAPEKGRFRTFLLALLQRFLCDQFDRSNAAKRGGGASVVSLDTVEAEALFSHTAASCASPEAIFERAWADTVVHTSLDRLSDQYEAEGRSRLFEELKVYLSHPADRADYGATGERLGMSVDAVAMAVMRLRRQYRAAVRAEVANTVATPAEIDDETRYLVNLLTS
jgi:RNA polymerase sigma-70 factor (ECF subfamily)